MQKFPIIFIKKSFIITYKIVIFGNQKFARMAELVDALDSGSSRRMPVGVRVPFRALEEKI